MPLQGGVPWPAAGVQDSVRAIVNSAAYRRSLGESLIGRAFRLFADAINKLASWAQAIPHARTISEVLALIVVGAIVVRAVVAKRLRDEQSRIRMGRGRGGRQIDAWSDAQALAAEGKYTEASHALYYAFLDRLAAEGVRLHRSKTSGDYVRELRRRGSPSQAAFRAFAREYDALIYGVGTCTGEDYQALLSLAQPMIATARAA